MKRYGQGWYGDSHRHYLASKGIMSSGGDLLEKSNMLGRVFDLKTTFDKGEAIVPPIANSGSEVLPRAFKAGEDDRVLPGSFRKGSDITGGAHHAAIEYASEKKKKKEGLSDDDLQYLEEQREVAGKQIDARWKENEEEEGKYFASKEDMVSFSPKEAAAFKKRFEEAQANGEEQFTWNGRQVLTSYAKYMVEYMKMRGYDSAKTEQWPKYKHVPDVKTSKQVFDFEEKTGRRHDGEPLGHYLNREATIEYDAAKDFSTYDDD